MFKQIAAVTAMNFKSLKSRLASSLVIIVGMACVVGVMLSMLSFSAGILAAANRADDPRLVMVTTKLARGPERGFLSRNVLTVVSDAPGIAKDVQGKPIADAY